jgi:hypothetical protein
MVSEVAHIHSARLNNAKAPEPNIKGVAFLILSFSSALLHSTPSFPRHPGAIIAPAIPTADPIPRLIQPNFKLFFDNSILSSEYVTSYLGTFLTFKFIVPLFTSFSIS